tara:strand:- start:2001 stop:2321 length:321 start_codon:yes stop_codon:yes gene_type:complete
MIYAMNLYDIRKGKEEIYKQYMTKSIELMDGISAELIASGHNPSKSLSGESRQHFVIMKFESMNEFEHLMSRQEESGVNLLREESTTNYIWTLYDEWDIGSWLYSR